MIPKLLLNERMVYGSFLLLPTAVGKNDLVRAKEAISHVAQAWHNVLLLVEALVHPTSNNLDVGVDVQAGLNAFWRGENAEKDEVLLRHAVFEDDLHGLDGATAGGQHRV